MSGCIVADPWLPSGPMRRALVVVLMAMAIGCASETASLSGPEALHEQVTDCDIAWFGVDSCAAACRVTPEERQNPAPCSFSNRRPCSDMDFSCSGATSPDVPVYDCPSTFATPDGTRGCCIPTDYNADYRVVTFFACPMR
jgi:hypothetical protein